MARMNSQKAIQALRGKLVGADIYGYELAEAMTGESGSITVYMSAKSDTFSVSVDLPDEGDDAEGWAKEALGRVTDSVVFRDDRTHLEWLIDANLGWLGMDRRGLLHLLQALEPNTLYRCMPYEKARIIDGFVKGFREEKNGIREEADDGVSAR